MHFFDTILKHKKIFFILFFFAIFAFGFFGINTGVANADAINDCKNRCPITFERIQCFKDCEAGIFPEPLPDDGDNCSFSIISPGKAFITYLSGGIILRGSWTIAYNTRNIFSGILAESSKKKITTNSFFTPGWKSVRDIANMMIVLGFVVVAIAFTLRMEGYGSKKMLFNLIAVALLVNFSGLLVGLIVDASRITMDALNSNGAATSPGTNLILSLEQSGMKVLSAYSCENEVLKFSGNAVLYAVMYLLVASTLFYLSFLYIARYAALGFLYILSPLAVVCWAFPATKKYFSKWLEELLKWAFIGISGIFVLKVCADLAAGIGGPGMGFPEIVTVVVFIFIGFKLVTKSSAIGASSVIGFAKGALGAATGAVTGLAMGGLAGGALGAYKGAKKGGALGGAMEGGKAAAKVGLNAATMGISNGAMLAGEKLGLLKMGTTAAVKEKRVNETASLYSKAYNAAVATGDETTIRKVERKARMGSGVDQAGAYKAVSDAKRLHKAFETTDPITKKTSVDTEAVARMGQYAESVGASGVVKAAKKSMPVVAGHDTVTTSAIKAEPAWSKRSNVDISREAVRRQHAGMTTPDMRDMHKSQMTGDFADDSNFGTLNTAYQRFTTEQKDHLRSEVAPQLADRARLAVPPPSSYSGTADQWKTITSKQRKDAWDIVGAKGKPAMDAEKKKWKAEETARYEELKNKTKLFQTP